MKRNLVAKHMRRYNKPKVQQNKKKDANKRHCRKLGAVERM